MLLSMIGIMVSHPILFPWCSLCRLMVCGAMSPTGLLRFRFPMDPVGFSGALTDVFFSGVAIYFANYNINVSWSASTPSWPVLLSCILKSLFC